MKKRSIEIHTVQEAKGVIILLRDDLMDIGLVESVCKEMELCLLEVIHNGIIHGNAQDELKCVKICWQCDSQEFSFCVEDEGEGIAMAQRFHKEIDPFSLEESGRGLFLVQQFLDEIWYNEKGNQVNGKIRWKNSMIKWG